MKLLILLLLCSCSMSYQYKTKNIKSKFKSYIKKSQKSAKNIEKDLNYQIKIIDEISSYKISNESIKDLKKYNQSCVMAFENIKKQDKELSKRYYGINLKGKYIDSVKHKKKYHKVEALRDYTEKHNQLMKNKISKYKKYRDQFFSVLKLNKYSVVKTKSVKSQFSKYEKSFKKNYKIVKRKLADLTKKLQKHGHKNKSAVLAKIDILKNIMLKIKDSKNIVSREVDNFDKEFSKYDEIIHGPNSPTFAALDRVETQTAVLNKQSQYFNKEAREINTLLK